MSIHSMADMRQRLNEIGPITFHLKMVQEPKRMLGIGDNPNRGRIHPQPIVQLELEKRFGQDVTYPWLEFMSCFVVANCDVAALVCNRSIEGALLSTLQNTTCCAIP